MKENIESVQMKFSVRLMLDETSIVFAFLGNLPNFEKGLKDWVFQCFLGELELQLRHSRVFDRGSWSIGTSPYGRLGGF